MVGSNSWSHNCASCHARQEVQLWDHTLDLITPFHAGVEGLLVAKKKNALVIIARLKSSCEYVANKQLFLQWHEFQNTQKHITLQPTAS